MEAPLMNSDRETLMALVQRYFDALHQGDAEALRAVFHPQARLFGEVKGEIVLRELEPYLRLVAGRTSPQQKGESQQMKLLALQIHGATAVATTQCPMLGLNYLDQLSLLKQDGQWRIVNKLYTHLDN